MTPTLRPAPRPLRSLPEALTRPVPGRHLVAGSLLLGLAAGGPLVAGGLLAGAAPAIPAVAQARSVPSPVVARRSARPAVLASRVAVVRASRGGLRTTLPLTRYELRTVPVGRTFSGLASWYGGAFQGRRTASGERFDSGALTAASPTLPFGTRLRVCVASRCVVVRVNDRGPYVASRVLDLSGAARAALGYAGVAQVTATPIGTRTVAVRRAVRLSTVSLPPPDLLPDQRADLAPVPSLAAPSQGVETYGVGLVGVTGTGLATARRRRS